jgi:predicted Fe-Mo cluster-binding NifX family protein
MKYALPTDDGKTVGKVFGRAKNFAIYDDADSSLTIVANAGTSAEHGAGTGSAAFLAEKGVGVVIAPEVGPKAEAALVAGGIRIEYADEGMELAKAISGIVA